MRNHIPFPGKRQILHNFEGAKLCLVVRRWSLWGLPLPLLLSPGGDAYEMAIDDRFRFHVEIRHRLIGLIVSYRGWLEIRPGAGHS